jgi:sugar phosphate isomerase/epimerase
MLRQAICNEVFQDWKFHEACKTVRSIGYTGIEISPFTLSDNPAAIPANERRQFRATIESEGLIFAGLHWLMVAPKGLHVTTPDKALRERSWNHILDLIDLCADLGPEGVMVFGSPQQRSTTGGSTVQEATQRFTEGLAGVASHALQRHVTILVEALPRAQSDVVNTLADAVGIVKEIGSPSVRTMFDTHNAADETEPHEVLVERYFDFIRHVHINEMDGRHPGTGNYDFKPVFAALERLGYRRWVSLEVFDFSAGAEKIAGDSLRYVEAEIQKLN